MLDSVMAFKSPFRGSLGAPISLGSDEASYVTRLSALCKSFVDPVC
jgi:hypothetical protein